MTKKEIDTILVRGNSHTLYAPGLRIGVTKLQVFLSIQPLLKGKSYWYALRSSFESSDNLLVYKGDINYAFTKAEPDREYLMTKKERDYLASLPDKIKIYRGMTCVEKASKDFGISWSLNKSVAYFFKDTYGRNYSTNGLKKVVYEQTVNKKDVIAFFDGRNESEIIYLSEQKVLTIKEQYPR